MSQSNSKLGRILAVALPIALAMSLTSCRGGEPEEGSKSGDIVVRGSFPLSGPLALFGTASKGMNAAFESANEASGIDGREIDYAVADDAYDPARAVSNTQKFIQNDHADVMVNFGAVGISAVPLATESKTPQLVFAGNSSLSNVGEQPFSRGVYPDIRNESNIIATSVVEADPDAKIGALILNNEIGTEYLAGLKQALGTEHADNLVASLTYEPTDAEVSSQITRLKAEGVDTLISVVTGAAGVQMLKYIEQIGWQPDVFIYGPNTGIKASMSQVGAGAVGIHAAQWLRDPADPQWKGDDALSTYLDDISAYGDGADAQDVNTLIGYYLGQTIVSALTAATEAGDLSPEAIMEAYDTLSGDDYGVLQPGITTQGDPADGRLIRQYQLVKFDGDSWVREGDPISAPK